MVKPNAEAGRPVGAYCNSTGERRWFGPFSPSAKMNRSSGNCEKWSGSGCIVKIETTVFANISDVK